MQDRLPTDAELAIEQESITQWVIDLYPIDPDPAFVFIDVTLHTQEHEDMAAIRRHKATYARDKRKGGYLIRVEGPSAEGFTGREVPVTLISGAEHAEKLEGMIWTGVDEKSGQKVALYRFEAKPKQHVEPEF